ncbi:hypothetical protein C8J57DRAFT_1269426 [Mycena rebaudengoi]|nr:hypothetical protein C8J57DRAFT_1269426 [Mycena rebaudengoi]
MPSIARSHPSSPCTLPPSSPSPVSRPLPSVPSRHPSQIHLSLFASTRPAPFSPLVFLSKLSDAGLARSHDTDTTPALQAASIYQRTSFLAYMNTPKSHRKSQDAMKDLAARSRSIRPSDYEAFRRECVTAFTSYQEHFARFPRLLGPLSADAGLANYDKTDQLETLLKDIVNANKDALSATYVLVDNIPGLGPVLGPIVYVVKCIVDELLDATENLTDAIINILKPLIAPLLDPILCGPLGLGYLCL